MPWTASSINNLLINLIVADMYITQRNFHLKKYYVLANPEPN